MSSLVYEFDHIVSGDCITDEVSRHQEVVSAIRAVLKKAETEPNRIDYHELTTAFARTLFIWQNPDVLTSALPLEMHEQAIRDYFQNNTMAYHVLNALVHTAMMSRDRWGKTEEERRREDARQVERALLYGKSIVEGAVEVQQQFERLHGVIQDHMELSAPEDPFTRLQRIADEDEE